MRDVVVLGWWGAEQRRLSFIELLQAELGIKSADAKALLDESLENATPVVIPVSPSARAVAVAHEIAAMGAEVRLLCGHARPDARDLAATRELAELRTQLEHALAVTPASNLSSTVSKLCPDLLTTEWSPRNGFEAARANCAAITTCDLEAQDASAWTGSFPLPEPLPAYYAEFGPLDVSLRGYGNGFFFPSLRALWDYQAGYRWNAVSGERLVNWPDDWLVIADQGADPFILSRADGSILFASHGTGTWDGVQLFPDVATMASAVTALGAVCTAAGVGLTDENGFVTAVWWRHLVAELVDTMGSANLAEDVLTKLGWERQRTGPS